MKPHQIVREILMYLLTIWFFYQGIVKMAHWNEYVGWNSQIPHFRQLYLLLGYGVPISEVALALMLQFSRHKTRVLVVLIVCQVLYLILVIWGYNSGQLTFNPVPEQFGRVGWPGKIWIASASLIVCLYCAVPRRWALYPLKTIRKRIISKSLNYFL